MRQAPFLLAPFVIALAACGEPHSTLQLDSAIVPPASAPLEVEFAGCQASRREPLTCWLRTENTHLNLWVASQQPPIIEVDGAAVRALVRPSAGTPGWSVQVEVPLAASELGVRVVPTGAVWKLPLEATQATPMVDALELALPPENAPDRVAYESALAKLEALSPRMTDYERVEAGRTRMLILQKLDRVAAAIEAGYRSLDEALRVGRPGEAIAIAEVLIYLLHQQGDAAGVELLLELEGSYLPLIADAMPRIRWHYYRGMQANASGDPRAALDELEAAENGARRLGLANDELAAASLRAPLLAWLGRHAERARVIDRIIVLTTESPRAERCRSANYLNSAGWALLLARAHSSEPDEAERLFERSLAFYSHEGGCDVGGDPTWTRNALETQINYTLEAVIRSDWGRAEERERAIDEHTLQPSQLRWLRYIRAELALGRGEASAALLGTNGEQRDDPLLAWQSLVVRGRALEALGDDDQALAEYRKAEDLLDSVVVSLGVDQGREGLTAGMHSSAMHAIRLLLKRRDTRGAVTVARRSRARALRPVGRAAAIAAMLPEERRVWEAERLRYEEMSRSVERDLSGLSRLPQDERDEVLRRVEGERRAMRKHLDKAYDVIASSSLTRAPETLPDADGLWLLYHPLPVGWAGFAITRSETRGVELGELGAQPSAQQLGDFLLAPFTTAIQSAGRVDILAMGGLDDVQFQALPWQGSTILDRVPIAYRLDLASSPRNDPITDRPKALVVADPAIEGGGLGVLVEAGRESDLVDAALTRTGWRVTSLRGADATHARVLESLGDAEWLHFSGHNSSAGGWDSLLPLAGEARLDLRQILALPRVPRYVVLSACKTGAIDTVHAAGGQHLAGAFLLAGADWVIATAADVPDRVAVTIAEALYDELASQGPADGPRLLQRAVLALGDEGESRTVARAAYRAWVP